MDGTHGADIPNQQNNYGMTNEMQLLIATRQYLRHALGQCWDAAERQELEAEYKDLEGEIARVKYENEA